MKALIFTLLVAITTSFAFTVDAQEQKKQKEKQAVIVVKPDTIRLGTIKVSDVTDELGKIEFKITNKGKEPLIVERVQGCCGTVIKEQPAEPIRPGKSFTVKAEFKVTPRASKINRSLSVVSNATNAPVIIPVIGEIVDDAPNSKAAK